MRNATAMRAVKTAKITKKAARPTISETPSSF
jgi:hypothetical protein